MVILTDASSTIIATQPVINGFVGRKLNEAIGRDAAVPSVSVVPGVLEVTLADGATILLALRNLDPSLGQVAVMQRAQRRARHMACRYDARGHAVLGDRLCRADAWLCVPVAIAADARRTATIEDTVHSPDRHRAQSRAAVDYGTGTLANGARVSGRTRCSTFSDCSPTPSCLASVRSAVWSTPDDVQLYELATQLTDSGLSRSIAYSACACEGNWIWLRARCELVRASRTSRIHISSVSRRRYHRAEEARRG